jgi:AMMECR1 domain-containing protein
MSDEEIIEYCRKLIQANLSQYTDTNLNALNEFIELSEKNNKKAILRHCIGIKALLERCIELLEENER